jgi:hypothetical protein
MCDDGDTPSGMRRLGIMRRPSGSKPGVRIFGPRMDFWRKPLRDHLLVRVNKSHFSWGEAMVHEERAGADPPKRLASGKLR